MISVVIPVFNGETYLSEAVDSIIGQTIGFNKIQIILVDDGSTDRSGEICDDYRSQYPNNIIVIHKTNGGVSDAKNEGIKAIEGKYVTFLDSDDLWERDAFDKLISFMSEHEKEIDCASAKIKIFGAKEYEHAMNFKYSETRVIDIDETPKYLITTGGNVIYKSAAIKGMQFNKAVSLGEDMLFNSCFMMGRNKYGIVSDAAFCYRKHEQGDSLSGDNYHNKKWYLDFPEQVLEAIAQRSVSTHGKIRKYDQEMIAYWCRYAIRDKGIHETLTEGEVETFDRIYKRMVSYLDEDVISSMQDTSLYIRNHLLGIKNHENIFSKCVIDGKGRLWYHDQLIFSPKGAGLMSVDSIRFDDGELTIEGATKISRTEGYGNLYAIIDGDEHVTQPIMIGKAFDERYMYDGSIASRTNKYSIKISPKSNCTIKFAILYNDKNEAFDVRVDLNVDKDVLIPHIKIEENKKQLLLHFRG